MLELLLAIAIVLGVILYILALKRTSKPNTQIPCPSCNQPMQAKIETKPTFKLEYTCRNPNCPLAKKTRS